MPQSWSSHSMTKIEILIYVTLIYHILHKLRINVHELLADLLEPVKLSLYADIFLLRTSLILTE